MTEDHDKTHVHTHGDALEGWWVLVISFVILFLGLYLRYSGYRGLLPKGLLIGAMGFSGYKIAHKGFKALSLGNITIDLLVTIAAIGAIAIGHLEEGTSVIILFNIAERLEAYATDVARKSIRSLMNLRPEMAIIQQDNMEIEVPVEEVLPGEVFVVRPGDRIPLDGRIIEGVSSVDQATITGESQPVLKEVGGEVYAGTINIDGYLSVQTTRMAQETVLSKILRMVEEAEESKSATEAFVDRFSGWYTPTIIILAVLVAILPPIFLQDSFEPWIYRSLVMLVVACPCALAIATPVAMVSSITSASRNGVLIKGSTYIEQMSNAGVFAFDKTGTLTKGELEVSEVISFGLPEKEVLRRAVALEAKSTHPIAKAILEMGNKQGIIPENVTDFRSHIGRGVEACLDDKTCIVGNLRLFQDLKIDVIDETVEKIESEGKTVVLVAEEGKIVGAIALMDKIREDALEAIRDLQARDILVEMLTGDNLATARVIAARLNVDGYQANLLPNEKVMAVDELRGIDYVIMVGDGVNDAPALAAADVGIAMGAMGSDIALETADIALMNDDLSKIDYALNLSKATMNRVKENIAISLIVKLGVAAMAFPGLVTLWLAVVVGDAGLSLAVVLNSLRLRGIKAEKK